MQTNERQLNVRDGDGQQWFPVAVVRQIATFVDHKGSLTDLLLYLLVAGTQRDMFSNRQICTLHSTSIGAGVHYSCSRKQSLNHRRNYHLRMPKHSWDQW